MKYYYEITLLPSYDIPLNFIWSKIYRQIHLAIVSAKNCNENIKIGVSFPQYKLEEDKYLLGNKLRIFAQEEELLKNMNISQWLKHFGDYIHITQIRKTPSKIKEYAIYSRHHQENSLSQKARRYAKRHNVSYEDAEKLFSVKQEKCIFPYIELKSQSNDNPFLLFIEKRILPAARDGNYGSYGLSNTATISEF